MEQTALLLKGTYAGTVVRIDEPVEMKKTDRFQQYYVPFWVEIDDQKLMCAFVGNMHTAVLIYRARNVWLGQQVECHIGTLDHNGGTFNTLAITPPTL